MSAEMISLAEAGKALKYAREYMAKNSDRVMPFRLERSSTYPFCDSPIVGKPENGGQYDRKVITVMFAVRRHTNGEGAVVAYPVILNPVFDGEALADALDPHGQKRRWDPR